MKYIIRRWLFKDLIEQLKDSIEYNESQQVRDYCVSIAWLYFRLDLE